MNNWIARVAATSTRHPRLVDGVIATVLLAASLTRAQLESRDLGARPGDVLPPEPLTLWVGAAIVAIVVPLAWRRRAPLTVLALSATAGVAALVLLPFEREITGLALLLALYSASAYGAKPWRTWLWAIALAAITAAATYRITMNQPQIDS